jgi:hypothetical protein
MNENRAPRTGHQLYKVTNVDDIRETSISECCLPAADIGAAV